MTPELQRLLFPKITPAARLRMALMSIATVWTLHIATFTETYRATQRELLG